MSSILVDPHPEDDAFYTQENATILDKIVITNSPLGIHSKLLHLGGCIMIFIIGKV